MLSRAGQYGPSEPPMKLFLQTTMIFFGTLIAAALVALGAPGHAEVEMAIQASPAVEIVSLLGLDHLAR